VVESEIENWSGSHRSREAGVWLGSGWSWKWDRKHGGRKELDMEEEARLGEKME
jgi:hypothetical protein